MRLSGAAAVTMFFLCFPFSLNSQVRDEEDYGFESFYGKKSFQEVELGIAPWSSPAAGLGGEIDFGFNTLSRKSADAAHWINYYGAAIEIASANFEEYKFSEYGTRDVSIWWASVLIESKLFYSDDTTVRPYVGMEFGIGMGGYGLSDREDDEEEEEDEDEYELSAGMLDMYQVGLEVGLHIMLNDSLALVISDTTTYGMGTIPGDALQVIQTTVSIGLSRWKGEKTKY